MERRKKIPSEWTIVVKEIVDLEDTEGERRYNRALAYKEATANAGKNFLEEYISRYKDIETVNDPDENLGRYGGACECEYDCMQQVRDLDRLKEETRHEYKEEAESELKHIKVKQPQKERMNEKSKRW